MAIYATVMGLLLLNELFCHTKGTDKYRKKAVFLCGLVLVFVSGFRYLVGTDYLTYMSSYRSYSDSAISWLTQPGVNLVARLAKFIYDDYATWFFIMAMIAIIPVVIMIIKYCDYPELGLFLFVGLGCWHFSFNIVKQCASAAILLCGFQALVKKDFKKWLIICLIASAFHFSALLMIPVFFLVNQRITLKQIIITFGIGFALLFFYDKLFELASFLKQGQNLVEIYGHTRNDSVNFIRILVNFAPGLLALIYRKKLDFEDRSFAVLFNMSLLNMALNIGSMNSIYLYRICCYTNIYNVLFVPAVLKRIKNPDRAIITLLMMLLYIGFWWHDLSVGTSLSEFHWIFER